MGVQEKDVNDSQYFGTRIRGGKLNPIIAALSLSVYMGTLFSNRAHSVEINQAMFIHMVLWCLGIDWSELHIQKGWKALLGEAAIHKALLQKKILLNYLCLVILHLRQDIYPR